MFSSTLNVCPDIFLNVVKRFDKKDKVSFKIYDVTDSETNNWNKYCLLSQEVKRTTQRNMASWYNAT